MSRRNLAECRAILTGASSGIGRALALELAGRGTQLVLTARREDRLRELSDELASHGATVHVVPGDITDADVRSRCLETARERLGGLDLLINNAGVGALGPFSKARADRLRTIMEVNFFAPLELIRSALPLLREGRQPMIVNISSVLGHCAMPNKSEYSASKFAMHGFSDALRGELSHEGIDVLVVSPSTTQSEFFDSVLEKKATMPPYARRAMPSEKVARKTADAIRRGKREIVLSFGGNLLVVLDRLSPTLTGRFLARFVR